MNSWSHWIRVIKNKILNLFSTKKREPKEQTKEPSHDTKILAAEKRIAIPTAIHLNNKNDYELIQRYTDSSYWDDVELLLGFQSILQQEKFIGVVEHKDLEMVRFFQSSHPTSQLFLLHHHSPQANVLKKEVPILLVHGASHQANLSWCCSIHEEKGLLYPLIQSGYDVYAISFAHSHGDNIMQAVQVSNAIQRICERTGVNEVNIITHSKGGVPTRLYLSDFCKENGTPYLNNVRKYIMLGTPNRGIDFVFRNIAANYGVIRMEINAPVACDSMLYFGTYLDTTHQSLYNDGGAFPGQSQLLYRWDDKYPPSPDTRTLYYGGQTVYYHSRGIDAALREGDYLMYKLLEKKVQPEVQLYALAGNHPFFKGIPGEQSGKSDGLVLLDSVLNLEPMATVLAQIRKKDELPLNHLDLLYNEKSHQWVLSALKENC